MTDPREGREKRQIYLGLRSVLVGITIIASTIAVFVAFYLSILLKRYGVLRPFRLVLLLLTVSLLISICNAQLIALIIIRPVKRLRMSMKQISEGNYHVRISENSFIKDVNQLNSSFNLMVRELQSTEILQTDFVASVSHEIKTPVAAIRGFAEILRYNNPDEKERGEIIERIILNSDRLSQLVSSVLLLSKIENGSQRRNCVNYRLDEQVRQALLMFENEWEKKELDFDVELDEIEFYGDESMLMHVWMNLISNAIKFSYERGKIGIYLSQTDRGVRFIIEDEGPGLPENSERHLFDKFYQGDSSHKGEGNGLGLALVKNILDRNSGSVEAENRPEGGSRFTVTLHQAAK